MNIPAIAFFNGKGGCGKTTGIVNIAGVLAARGEKILVIDFDKQRNATQTLLQDEQSEYDVNCSTIYDVFTKKACFSDIVKKSYIQGIGQKKTHYVNIDVLPADKRFQKEEELSKMDVDIAQELKEFVSSKGYTYILIDMPPSNDAINKICFAQIANNIVVPFSPDIYSIEGYNDLMEIINNAREQNEELNILGIYLSRYRERNQNIREALKGFGSMFIDDVQIPFSAQVEDTILDGRPISFSKRKGKVKEAFEALTTIIDKRIII